MSEEEKDAAIETIVKALVAFFTGKATLHVGQLPVTFNINEEKPTNGES